MAEVGRSPRRFLERRGLVPTLRLPMSRLAASGLTVRDYPLETVSEGLPLPAYRAVVQGDPVPDRGLSGEWPHPPAEVGDG